MLAAISRRTAFGLSLSLALIFASIAFVIQRTPDLDLSFRSFSVQTLAGVLAALVIGAYLAALRLQLIARDLGYRLSIRDSISALGLGQIGGLLFFQLAGQLAARGAFFAKRDIPVSGSVLMVGYERLAAMLVSVILAAAGVAILFGHITFQLSDASTLARIVLGGALVGTVSAALVWGRFVGPYLKSLTIRNYRAFARCLALSLALQLSTMAAYLIAARQFAPDADFIQLGAAFALVMFAASLPISFAGWGVRELSAIAALGAIGVQAKSAFIIALVVGLGSLPVAIACAAFAVWSPQRTSAPGTDLRTQIDYTRLLDATIPILAAMAVLFQIILPTEGGGLNVNLADPLALLAGALFVLRLVRGERPAWLVDNLFRSLIIATLALGVAFAVGYVSFGWSQWAAANKLFGWLVLLAFGATGATLTMRFGRDGLHVLLQTFAISAAALVVMDMSLALLAAYVDVLKPLVRIPMEGLSQNRNAFSFVIMMALSISIAQRSRTNDWISVICVMGIWFTGSRAGAGAAAIIVLLSLYARTQTLSSVAIGGTIVGAFALILPNIPEFVAFRHVNSIGFDGTINLPTVQNNSTMAHLDTVKDALAMFWSHPILGAGLGAYLNGQKAVEVPVIIHSTPFWLLAEAGIIGFLAFAVPFFKLFSVAVRRSFDDRLMVTLSLILVSFGIMSLVHELLYQRCMWLLIGALIVIPSAARTSR